MRTLLASLGALLLLGPAHARQDAPKLSDKALKQALKEKKTAAVDAAAKDLLVANSPEAMKILLAASTTSPKPEKDPLPGDDAWWHESYFTLLNAAASFTDAPALNELAEFIVKNKTKPVARDALSCVSNHGQKELIAVCLKVLEGGFGLGAFVAFGGNRVGEHEKRRALAPLRRQPFQQKAVFMIQHQVQPFP